MFTSEDLGGHIIKVDTVLRYDDSDRSHILVLSDTDSDGLVHIYYGPSLADALQEISELVDSSEMATLSNQLSTYLSEYHSSFLAQQQRGST